MATSERTLRAIDLFCGCGGLTTGLKLAGFRVLAAVELDRGAAAAFRANHPEVRVYEQDIRELPGSAIRQDLKLRRGDLDLLAGCPPCQGFSRLRTRNKGRAVRDPRNNLIREYVRLVAELEPRALLFENVPGLLRDRRYRVLVRDLNELGYTTVEALHNAADFGVPQRRKRLILVGGLGGAIAIPAGESGDSSLTVRRAIGHLQKPGSTGDPAHDVVEHRSPAMKHRIRVTPHNGGSRSDLPATNELRCHQDCTGFSDVYGRMRWDEVAPTITSGFVNPSKGRFLHPEQDRCVTPREAALLQTFPANYFFPMKLGKYPVATMIGNAFPPELARQHATLIAAALRSEPR